MQLAEMKNDLIIVVGSFLFLFLFLSYKIVPIYECVRITMEKKCILERKHDFSSDITNHATCNETSKKERIMN